MATKDSAIRKSEGRLYMATPGGEAELLYRMEKSVMSIYRTFVPETERGKGIAEKLALEAFAIAKEKGLKVRPDCPYIEHFIEKHKEFAGMSVGSDSGGACLMPPRD